MLASRMLTAAILASVVGAAAIMPASSAAAAVVAKAEPSNTERNRAFVSAAFDRWAAGGTDFFAEVLSPDIVWTIEGSGPSAGVYRGFDDFTARAVRPFVSRLKAPVRPGRRQVWADGDHVVVQWEGEAVAADDQPYQNDYVWIFRFEEGEKAVAVTAFLDLAPYDDVLRRIPAPADPAQ